MTQKQRFLILASFIIVMYLVLRFYFKNQFPSFDEIAYTLQSSGFVGPLLYIMLSIGRGFLLFPPNATIFFLSGLVFGPIYGPLYALLGGLSCAIVEFGIARYLGLPVVRQIIGTKTRLPSLDPFLSSSSIMLLRLVLMGPPYDLVNYGLGLTKARWHNYIIGTAFGLIPSSILFTQFGYSLQQSPSKFLILTTVVITIGATLLLGRRYKNWKDARSDDAVQIETNLGENLGPMPIVFPSKQNGFSTIYGYFMHSEHSYVIKYLRTRTIKGLGYRISLRKLLGRLPIKDNIFLPSEEVFENITRYIEILNKRLRTITREQASLVLLSSFEFARNNLRFVETLLQEIFPTERTTIDLFPAGSQAVWTKNPLEGNDLTIAVIQDNINNWTSETVIYIYPNTLANNANRTSHILMLVLMALAYDLAKTEQLGLDLFPHIVSFLPFCIIIPNVLVNVPSHTLTYIDVIGLFSSNGNLIQRAGNKLLYGKNGIVRILAARIFASLIKGVSS